MTAVAMATRPDARAEWRSFLAVLATTVIAVAVGLALLAATDNPSRRVEQGGVPLTCRRAGSSTSPSGTCCSAPTTRSSRTAAIPSRP